MYNVLQDPLPRLSARERPCLSAALIGIAFLVALAITAVASGLEPAHGTAVTCISIQKERALDFRV